MGKNLDAARLCLAKRANVDSLLKQLNTKGWNIVPISLVSLTDDTYANFLKQLLESEEVVDTGEVLIYFAPGIGCEVKEGGFWIGVETPIDKVLQFLKE